MPFQYHPNEDTVFKRKIKTIDKLKEMKQRIPFIAATGKMKIPKVCLSKEAVTDPMLVPPHPAQMLTRMPSPTACRE